MKTNKMALDALKKYLAANDPEGFGCACNPSGYVCGPCGERERQKPLIALVAALEAVQVEANLCDDHAWAGQGECPQCAAVFNDNWLRGGLAEAVQVEPEAISPYVKSEDQRPITSKDLMHDTIDDLLAALQDVLSSEHGPSLNDRVRTAIKIATEYTPQEAVPAAAIAKVVQC